MTDGSSLINIGELSKPVDTLINKISDAIGGIARPGQIIRIAKAEAVADEIKTQSRIKNNNLEHRALQRFTAEEMKKQRNIETITAKALPDIAKTAQPENMEEDWIANFFDKCRLISDDEMQSLWSKILAGEANSPGSYSKRTINLLSSLDKSDAISFQTLCSFNWFLGRNQRSLIYDINSEIYSKNGITFSLLTHLASIGLLRFEVMQSFNISNLPKHFHFAYFDQAISIEFPNDKDNVLTLGYVLLSKVGEEIASICNSKPIPEFFDYIIEKWVQEGLILSSPISYIDEI